MRCSCQPDLFNCVVNAYKRKEIDAGPVQA
jgi:hypothetical protein